MAKPGAARSRTEALTGAPTESVSGCAASAYPPQFDARDGSIPSSVRRQDG
jgi:hypothetical protein